MSARRRPPPRVAAAALPLAATGSLHGPAIGLKPGCKPPTHTLPVGGSGTGERRSDKWGASGLVYLSQHPHASGRRGRPIHHSLGQRGRPIRHASDPVAGRGRPIRHASDPVAGPYITLWVKGAGPYDTPWTKGPAHTSLFGSKGPAHTTHLGPRGRPIRHTLDQGAGPYITLWAKGAGPLRMHAFGLDVHNNAWHPQQCRRFTGSSSSTRARRPLPVLATRPRHRRLWRPPPHRRPPERGPLKHWNADGRRARSAGRS